MRSPGGNTCVLSCWFVPLRVWSVHSECRLARTRTPVTQQELAVDNTGLEVVSLLSAKMRLQSVESQVDHVVRYTVGHAHMVFAGRAESAPRCKCNSGLVEQFQAEFA